MNNNQYTQMARKIPNAIRDLKILIPTDPIANAVPSRNDPMMMELAKIWYVFIQPLAIRDYECPHCLKNILENWREIKQTLVDLKTENDMLNLL